MINNHSSSQSYPFPMPVFVGSSNSSSPDLLDNDAPARVKMALELLSHLSVKLMPRAAATEHAIEWATVPPLTANEVAAQGAACNVLIKYFSGDLKPDGWEAVRRKAATTTKTKIISKKPGTLLRCFACSPDYTGDCHICNEKRTILVYPSGN